MMTATFLSYKHYNISNPTDEHRVSVFGYV